MAGEITLVLSMFMLGIGLSNRGDLITLNNKRVGI